MTQRDEREKLADALKSGELTLVWCHPRGLGADDATPAQFDMVEAALRTPADSEAHAEIQRLLDAKRRALAIADERAKENVALREALKSLLDAAKLMPRTTPKPGGAGTVHDYKIEAAHVWGFDRMCMTADTALSSAPPASEGAREAEDIRWQRVNDEPFEYAIQQGQFGDEFVKLLNGKCLRRPTAPEPAITTEQLDKAQFGRVLHARPEPTDTPDEGPDPLGYAKGERA